ncbi:MAG: SIR2 family protein [Rhodoferax sp.]
MNNDENAIHFRAIRQAFANNNAAVMVGAGFSRNADGGDSLATWPDVAKALWTELNPDAKEENFSTAMVTQLGEQYARVFSVPALENLLKQLIPDDKVVPNQLHDQLLRLPWSEIFTTNYDTLLERAAERIIDRAHFTVCCREDIPMSKILGRRRIVKLHGSFPSQRPFIFTEENYRKYPQDFAPFVNMVRQSLLENVFCLIGFSGDDPNFRHWIGWVRDMLDDHALPIYLFVHSQPPLGQRRLLEARRVIPVVVPTPADCEASDYRSRYLELFKILRAPLDTPDEEWGTFSVAGSSIAIPEDSSAQLQRLVETLPTLVALRASYPGWLIAPTNVRRKFANSFDQLFFRFETKNPYGLQEQPHALVALFAYYAWQKSVLLAPIIDDFAESALEAIEATFANNSDANPTANNLLSAMGIVDSKSFRTNWIEACIGLLRWARQELKLEIFSRVRSLLELKSKAKGIIDIIEYEAILFDFYLGDVEAARRKLSAWQPGNGDPYMLVRKGSLMSELGEVDTGLALCMHGIQNLRAAQRIGRRSLLPLSQEAWACLIAHNIQRAKKLSDWRSPRSGTDADESIDHLSNRLLGLAEKGIDVRREYEELLALLNAEAQPPSVPRYRFSGFDLGVSNTTQRFGLPSELRSKISAAEAWLNLADIVCIVPRIGNVRFSVDAYTQAAWWIQYQNTARRMLSVAIRTGEDDIFKPKDETVPQHKTGWLSRYQVARTSVDLAAEICERALIQTEAALASTRSHHETERICKFNAEIFSRLVIRIDQVNVVLAFAHRVIKLHGAGSLQERPQVWEHFGLALRRCLEALPPDARHSLIGELIKMPILPTQVAPGYLARNWVTPLRSLVPRAVSISPEMQFVVDSEVTALLAEIVTPVVTHSDETTLRKIFVWDRLFALKALGLISKAASTAIGEALWNGVDSWPLLPQFSHPAAFFWPTPKGLFVVNRFRSFVLGSKVENISSPSVMTVQGSKTRRAWGFPVRNAFFADWISAHEKQPWPLKDLISSLKVIKVWWDSEWEDIEHDVEFVDDLREAIVARLHLIDEVLDLSADRILAKPAVLPDDLVRWLELVVVKAQAIGCPMSRFRARIALHHKDSQAMLELQAELSAELVSTNTETKWEVRKALRAWIKGFKPTDPVPDLVLDTIFSAIAARRVNALGTCLYLVKEILVTRREWASESRLGLVRVGMNALLKELDYVVRVTGTDISDEHIPLLRYYCASLAYAAADHLGTCPDWATAWIDVAKVDPLPDLRFMKCEPTTGN